MLQQAECTIKNNHQMVTNQNKSSKFPQLSNQLPINQFESHFQSMDTSEQLSQNRVPSFKTNINPFANKQVITTPQPQNTNLSQRALQKPQFFQIQNKTLDLEESQIQNHVIIQSQNIDDRFNQLMQTSMSIIHQESGFDKYKQPIQQEVVIGGDDRHNLNCSFISQACSSSSSDITTTSSCVQWEQVMQNRRNLVTILQEVVLDSNMHISIQKNKLNEDSIKPTCCYQITKNQINNQYNNSPENKTQYSVFHNEQLEKEWEKECPFSTPKNKQNVNAITKENTNSEENDSHHQEEEDQYFDEKESLYFLKKQHKQSLFGSISMNNINNQKNFQGMMTKTTMNTINNLSTMTTINQSPQINKRNSKCFVSQHLTLN